MRDGENKDKRQGSRAESLYIFTSGVDEGDVHRVFRRVRPGFGRSIERRQNSAVTPGTKRRSARVGP
ncbi:MAG: hypothetical protein AVDCRST_MAG12-1249 [uncultured Rubrobacteraceae bacterium]|uniref:Uncharacterized protein n=1 Tax=uncultured Rubrobacteraceae bacterium TaxID=349277 RepID=A0A6J4RT33_9ACTN|nr:MAG: hypothetical protein AVDCRST_MAG12-1249 [uncultured Rubrobacteraceae bacterium]